jgi:hypothetical protein
MNVKYLGSQTGQTWEQIPGREQHRYVRILVSWSGSLRSDWEPGWSPPPPVVARRAVEVR